MVKGDNQQPLGDTSLSRGNYLLLLQSPEDAATTHTPR